MSKRSGSVGICRMHDQLEPAPIRQSNGSKVTHIAGRESIDAERLGQRDDRGVDEAQTKIREASVHVHRTRELAEEQARHYGLTFFAVRRPQGDLLDHMGPQDALAFTGSSATGARGAMRPESGCLKQPTGAANIGYMRY